MFGKREQSNREAKALENYIRRHTYNLAKVREDFKNSPHLHELLQHLTKALEAAEKCAEHKA